jgi:hypothetical protein
LCARVSTPCDASATIKADAARTVRVVARASRASLCVPRPRSGIQKRGRRCSFSSKSHFARYSSTWTRRRRLSVCVVAALVEMRCVVTPVHETFPNPQSSPPLPLHSEGRPKIVRCRWCPSARGARRDAVTENRSPHVLLTRLVAAVGAAVGTTGTARFVHVSITSFVSSRLARLALCLSLSRLSRRRLRVRRIPSKPRVGACSRSTARRSRAPN